jgi:hypothetical protein
MALSLSIITSSCAHTYGDGRGIRIGGGEREEGDIGGEVSEDGGERGRGMEGKEVVAVEG